jgi:hypothetical protein
MQHYLTPNPGVGQAKPQFKTGPNIVNREDYKLHVLKREYAPGEWEILFERWIPETGWTRTQILCTQDELVKIQAQM